jgi:alcohol dehydrogenase
MQSQAMTVNSGDGALILKERVLSEVKGKGVLIEIHASSMNPHDWKFYGQFKKLYQKTSHFPDMLLGHDLSGVVLAVGGKVKNFEIGDEVFAMSAKTGAFGQHLIVDERMLAHKPHSLNHHEAASVPMAALTAWQAYLMTKLEKYQKVLVIGGSGGVGIFAIQIAKALGAEVTTVCSTANVALVKDLGADHIVDYKFEDFHDLDQEFDIVFDVIGGESKESCKNIIKIDGQFISTSTNAKKLIQVFTSRIHRFLIDDTVTATTFLAMPVGRHLATISKFIEEGKIKTLVDKVFPLQETEQAMEYSKLGRTKGKIVISVK